MPEVLIAALILGGISLGVMELAKQQSAASIRSKIDADIAQAKAEILSLVSSPTHCNANFQGVATSATPVSIAVNTAALRRCNTGSCITATGRADKFTVRSSTDWTGNPTGVISERVRITSVNRTILPASATTFNKLGTASLEITFSMKPLTGPIINSKMNFSTAVVLDNAGTTVVGCPRAWNTTNVYM